MLNLFIAVILEYYQREQDSTEPYLKPTAYVMMMPLRYEYICRQNDQILSIRFLYQKQHGVLVRQYHDIVISPVFSRDYHDPGFQPKYRAFLPAIVFSAWI